MADRGLREFIDEERATIIGAWEEFARTLLPAAEGMDSPGLRDHADDIITAIVADMGSEQSPAQQSEQGRGRVQARHLAKVGTLHAALRIESGFKLQQIVAEYRALRSTVLRLWRGHGSDPEGIARFNESIDEAMTEAVEEFTKTSERYRDETLGILGHDLRSPLAAIMAGLGLLQADPLHQRASVLERISNSAERMRRMIGQLLDFTRTRFSHAIPLSPYKCDLEAVCREVIDEFEARAPDRVRFVSHGDLRGVWDQDRLAEVLSNLVQNAILHGSKGEKVTVAAEDLGDRVSLTVHNHGRAIPPGRLTTIFEPMTRQLGEDKRKTGLGLGLYIARQVVLAHGGTLDVTSTDEDGTTFTVVVPRVPRATPPEPPSHLAEAHPG